MHESGRPAALTGDSRPQLAHWTQASAPTMPIRPAIAIAVVTIARIATSTPAATSGTGIMITPFLWSPREQLNYIVMRYNLQAGTGRAVGRAREWG